MHRSLTQRRTRLSPWLGCLLVLLSIGLLAGQGKQVSAEEATPQDLPTMEPVMVTSPRVATPLDKVPAAISAVGQDDIQTGQPTVGLDESLVRIPGVFSQNRFNFAQDLRLAIRGFGTRAAFGIRGIKILVDGIPHTLPDGQSQVDSLDLGLVQRIEVIRGPTSALYGNASGGVISIVTEDGPARPVLQTRTTHGAFGLWKMHLKTGGQAGPLNLLFNASRLELGGYRDQSRTESLIVNGKLRLRLDAASDLTALITVLDSPRADDPGGLTAAQVEADRRQAAPLNRRFRAGEEVAQQRFGLVYRRDLGSLHEVELTSYVITRQFRGRIPFRVVEFDRYVLGGSAQYIHHGRLFGNDSRLALGLDVQHQLDQRQNFDNEAGLPGATVLLDQDEAVTSLGVYVQEEFRLLDRLTLVLGGRYDRVRFEVEDFLLANGDDSGTRTFDQLTGRFGLLFDPWPGLNLYVAIAQSFETPTTTELVNRPDGQGGLNPEVEPQRAINYEVGVKGQAFERLRYQLALFYILLQDELIPFEEAGRVFFRNAGESERYGVELGLTFALLDGLRASLAYSYLDATFREFVKNGVDLAGNAIPGLPPHQVFGELLYRHPAGLYGGIDVLYVGGFFVDDENTEKNGAYTVANLRLGYEHVRRGWKIAPFLGLQNLFDERYNSNVRINAVGGRFFEPAPVFNIYGGLTVAYQW